MKLEPTSQPPGLDPIGLNIEEPLCAVFRRKLKAENQKYTPERAHILNTIIELDGLFEADVLLETVRAGGFRVSKATIYRTLKLLEEAGIIQQVPFDRDQSHYQLAYGKKPDTVLINVDTGDVEAIEVPELIALRDTICKAKGLTPEGHRLQIFVRSS
jgi:Fur family ferric uptake transcriptional regulator